MRAQQKASVAPTQGSIAPIGRRATASRLAPPRSLSADRLAPSALPAPRFRGAIVSEPSEAAEREADHRAGAVSRAAATVAGARDTGQPLRVDPRDPGAGEQPLPPRWQRGFETALGADFSRVRTHTDAEAATGAAALGAAAYTFGHDVWFAAGRLDLATEDGRRLLAHELIHVVDHAHLGRVHCQREGAPNFSLRKTGLGSVQDPVVLIEMSQSSGAAVLTTRSGAQISAVAKDVKLEPNVYYVTPHYLGVKSFFSIKPASGSGSQFYLEVNDPALRSESGDTYGAFNLSYANAMLRVTPSVSPQTIERVDLDQTFAEFRHILDTWHVGGTDEQRIISLIQAVPAPQSGEFLTRLSQPYQGATTWLDVLDDRISGENNQLLHEALAMQHLRSNPAKAAASLENAPVLPWHDVMGFFEDAATFAAERSRPGKVRVRYLGAVSGGLMQSKEFGDEIPRLPQAIFIGGVEYDEDQPLIIHDYDAGRFVTVVAGELAGYQHLGVRNFLGHVATVASFAIPVSSATSVAGRIAVITLERVLPAIFLLVDENRRNLVKWFPKWGPEMIRYSDMLQTATAAIGFAQIAHSGFGIFKRWRDVSRARTALEGAARIDAEAERVAAELQRQAETAYAKAEEFQKAEAAAGGEAAHAPAGAPGEAAPKAGPKSAGVPAPPSREPAPAATGGRARQGVNRETSEFLSTHQDVANALEHSPHATEALKFCQSLCFPKFITEAQVNRLEQALERADKAGVRLNTRGLQRKLHGAKEPAMLEALIADVETGINDRIALGSGAKGTAQPPRPLTPDPHAWKQSAPERIADIKKLAATDPAAATAATKELEKDLQAIAERNHKSLTGVVDPEVDKAVDKAFAELSEIPLTGGKKPRVGEGQGARVPTRRIEQLDMQHIALLPGETQRQAVARVREVVGRKIAGSPLEPAWEAARERVLGGRDISKLGKDEMLAAYKRAQTVFWDEARSQPAAKAWLEAHGFQLGETGAPHLRVNADLAPEQTRISLDHSIEKRVAPGKAIDADNLVFEFHDANSTREIVQMRHPQVTRPPGPNEQHVPITGSGKPQ